MSVEVLGTGSGRGTWSQHGVTMSSVSFDESIARDAEDVETNPLLSVDSEILAIGLEKFVEPNSSTEL